MSMTDGAAVAAAEEEELRQQQEQPQESEIEAKARRMGWRPKDEYRGDPEKWVTAEEYVRKADEEFPVLRENYDRLDRKFAKFERDTEATVGELNRRLEEASHVVQDLYARNKKVGEQAYKRARADILAEMRTAAGEADTETFDRAQAKLEELDQERRTAAEPEPPEPKTPASADAQKPPAKVHPAVTQWIEENPWYDADDELKAVANAVHTKLLRDKPGMSIDDNLAEVRRQVRQRYPEKFGNPRREEPPTVGEPGGRPMAPNPKDKVYANLPPAAKAECDRFIAAFNATNPREKMTREKWVADYEWED